jgi:hypothetical protein
VTNMLFVIAMEKGEFLLVDGVYERCPD